MLEYIPSVTQVVPYDDYTVDVYFEDGKIVRYDVKSDLLDNVFKRIKEPDIFMNTCTILNGTLAWDVAGGRNVYECIDIDPWVLYELPHSKERLSDDLSNFQRDI